MNKEFQQMQEKHQKIIENTISKFPAPKKLSRIGENIVIFDFKNLADYHSGVALAEKLDDCRMMKYVNSKKRISLMF